MEFRHRYLKRRRHLSVPSLAESLLLNAHPRLGLRNPLDSLSRHRYLLQPRFPVMDRYFQSHHLRTRLCRQNVNSFPILLLHQ